MRRETQMRHIRIDDLTFRYEGREDPSIRDVSLAIPAGQFVVLTGPSGCGKTTLIRCLTGLVPHFYPGELSGHIVIDDRDITKLAGHELTHMIGSVFQDPRSQFFTTSTDDELAFACENAGLPSEEINTRIDATYELLEIAELRGRSIFELSSGEKQSIAIASAIAMRPGILVLDEPSANLDVPATERLARTLQRLKSRGHTIVVSDHRLWYLAELADRILHMRDGRLVDEWTPREFAELPDREREVRGLRRSDLARLSIGPKAPRCVPSTDADAARLSVRGVSAVRGRRAVLENASFTVPAGPGSVIGLTGRNGAGKTTLARALCGLADTQAGSIEIDGSVLSAKRRLRTSHFVMQDTDYQLFTESVVDELRLGARGDLAQRQERIELLLKELDLWEHRESHPLALSGGQKQRVTIAVAAMSDARLILLDEPTSGLDATSMTRVSQLIRGFAEQGATVLTISHDLEFLAATCDRVLHLVNGSIDDDFDLAGASVRRLEAALR